MLDTVVKDDGNSGRDGTTTTSMAMRVEEK